MVDSLRAERGREAWLDLPGLMKNPAKMTTSNFPPFVAVYCVLVDNFPNALTLSFWILFMQIERFGIIEQIHTNQLIWDAGKLGSVALVPCSMTLCL